MLVNRTFDDFRLGLVSSQLLGLGLNGADGIEEQEKGFQPVHKSRVGVVLRIGICNFFHWYKDGAFARWRMSQGELGSPLRLDQWSRDARWAFGSDLA